MLQKISFLLLRHRWIKKVLVEQESSLSMGLAIILLALFPQTYKRKLDIIVESTATPLGNRIKGQFVVLLI